MRTASLTLLIIFLFGLNASAQVDTQTRFVVTGEIAPDTLLGNPLMVESLEDGRFVVSEMRSNRLKIFDREGSYIRSVSRQGRGPGENISIGMIHVNQAQDLLVVDERQARISIFREMEHVTDLSPFSTVPDIQGMLQKSGGGYLVHSRQAEEYLFYEWDPEFVTTGNRYVPASELQTEEETTLDDVFIAGRAASALTEGDDLVVAPPFYAGKLFVYRAGQDYRSPGDLIRTGEYGSPFEKHQGDPRNIGFEEMSEELLSSSSGPDGPTYYYHFNRSLGLFTLSTGEILHLVQVWNREEERVQLLAEMLDATASQVVGVHELTEVGDLVVENHLMEGSRHALINLQFLHMDAENKLYIAAGNDSMEPELHVVTIKFTPH